MQNYLANLLCNLGAGGKLRGAAALLVCGLAASILPQKPVNAQAAYGSYIGVGGSFGLTEARGEDTVDGVVIAARYKFLRLPVSLRAQGLIGGDGSAFVPTISYDLPITWQADVYLGAGGAFVTGQTPVGDRNSFAIQPGIDYAIPNSSLVLFGNAIIAFDAYRRDDKTAVSLQGGIGLQF
ncbi:MAG: hypothetical protein Fur0025_28800 [Oscillatoriaceae cyanobacterium]